MSYTDIGMVNRDLYILITTLKNAEVQLNDLKHHLTLKKYYGTICTDQEVKNRNFV